MPPVWAWIFLGAVTGIGTAAWAFATWQAFQLFSGLVTLVLVVVMLIPYAIWDFIKWLGGLRADLQDARWTWRNNMEVQRDLKAETARKYAERKAMRASTSNPFTAFRQAWQDSVAARAEAIEDMGPWPEELDENGIPYL